jgi:hypothetical protein
MRPREAVLGGVAHGGRGRLGRAAGREQVQERNDVLTVSCP